ncbi:hypothetical protein B0H19DRAFT_1235537 [Mycena capillaripes]|nr:hypothetical protein B0H19DRAFT_1235537 [Mycena capillaripes]
MYAFQPAKPRIYPSDPKCIIAVVGKQQNSKARCEEAHTIRRWQGPRARATKTTYYNHDGPTIDELPTRVRNGVNALAEVETGALQGCPVGVGGSARAGFSSAVTELTRGKNGDLCATSGGGRQGKSTKSTKSTRSTVHRGGLSHSVCHKPAPLPDNLN